MTSNKAPKITPILVDRQEAAAMLGISKATLERLTAAGHIQSAKIGARRLWSTMELHEYAEAQLRRPYSGSGA